MAWTTNKTDTFRHIAERIRNLFSLFKSNRSYKRLKNDKASTPKYIIDLLAVDIPQKSLADEIVWDTPPTRVQTTATTRGRTEDISRAPPEPPTNIPEERVTDEVFWDVLDRFETRTPAPFVISALILTPGLLMHFLGKESLSEYIG
jgi:hypothetical protein